MSDETLRTISNQKVEVMEEFVKDQVGLFQKNKEANTIQRDEFAIEKTVATGSLFITVNIGIITATIFLISIKDDLNIYSRILVLCLIFNFLSIILEITYRKIVLDNNINIGNKRNVLFDKVIERFTGLISRVGIHNVDSFFKEVGEIRSDYNSELNTIFKSLADVEKLHEWKRTLAERFLFIGIAGIILIVLIESGVVNLIANIITNNSVS